MKNKEKSSSNMNIYLGDIHSITSPPAKLCYILMVYTKLRGWSADQIIWLATWLLERNKQHSGWLVKAKLFLSYIFFSAYHYRIIDVKLQQNNYILRYSLTIAKVTLSFDKKDIAKGRIIN